MVDRATLFPPGGGGGVSVKGTWDVTSSITNAAANPATAEACTIATVSETEQTLTPVDPITDYGGGVWASTVLGNGTVDKDGLYWSRIRIPTAGVGDNWTFLFFGFGQAGDTFTDVFTKLTSPSTPGDGSYCILMQASVGSNLSFQGRQDGTLFSANATATHSPGDEIYTGINFATGDLYVQVNAGTPELVTTIDFSAEALGLEPLVSVAFSSATHSLEDGSISFDMSDYTGTHIGYRTLIEASYPAEAANNVFAVQNSGTVDSVALNEGDVVVFNAAGDSFVRLNNEAYDKRYEGNAVWFDPGIAATTSDRYKTWTEAFNAVRNSDHKDTIYVVDRGSGVTIDASVGVTDSGFWDVEGIKVVGVNTENGNKATLNIPTDTAIFTLNTPNATGTIISATFENLNIVYTSTAFFGFTKLSGLPGQFIFKDCIIDSNGSGGMFGMSAVGTDFQLVFLGNLNYLIQRNGATLFSLGARAFNVQIYSQLNTSWLDKPNAITGSNLINWTVYQGGDVDIYPDEDWTLFSGFSGTVTVRSQVSVKNMVLDTDTDFIYNAIKHAQGQLGFNTLSGVVSVQPTHTTDYIVDGAATITIDPDTSETVPGRTLEFFLTTAAAVSIVAGAGVTINTRPGGLGAVGQYSVLKLKHIALNTWIGYLDFTP